MNVLFLSSDYPPNLIGGVGVYTAQFAAHLAKRGHQAFVITRTEATPCEYLDGQVRVWRVRPQPSRWFDVVRDQFPAFTQRVEYSLTVAQQLRHILRTYPIDLVESCESHAEGFWHFAFHRRPYLFIKLHTPDHIIFTLNQQPLSPDLRLVLMLEEWWLRRATALVGLTEALTHEVGKRYQLKTDGIPKVRVPVDVTFFSPSPTQQMSESPEILFVGRLEFRKGPHVLLRAMPRILRAVPTARFMFIGQDCGMRALLEQYWQDPQYQDRIHWQASASRDELRAAYQRSQVCVVPSLWENHPTVCLEAMSCGAAVVASHAGGIPEIIAHGVTGLLVPAGSSQALAKSVIELLTHPSKRTALGQAARVEMERRYSAEHVFDETIALYEELLRARN